MRPWLVRLLKALIIVIGLLVVGAIALGLYFSVPALGPERLTDYAHTRVHHPCKVDRVQRLPGGGSGSAWSVTDRKVYLYAASDEHGVRQIYRRNLVTGAGHCLTCAQMSGGPPVGANKGFASYDPSGRFMIMQVAMNSHKGYAGSLAGVGYQQDIWAWDVRTKHWFNLTHYPMTGVHGALLPRISHNGRQIAWAEIYRGPPIVSAILYYSGLSLTGPIWGYWRLDIADLVYDHAGVHLAHVRHYAPGHAYFYETQDWSPDDRYLLFASSIGTDSPWKESIWIMDTLTHTVKPFTSFAGSYSEHATFTDNGHKIVYMSSKCCQVNFRNPVTFGKTFRTEMYIANVDGSDDVQLTHFNDSAAAPRVVSDKAFINPFDGYTAILEQQVLTPHGDSPRLLLTLSGNCGA